MRLIPPEALHIIILNSVTIRLLLYILSAYTKHSVLFPFVEASAVIYLGRGLRKASQPSSLLDPNRLTVSTSQPFCESDLRLLFI